MKKTAILLLALAPFLVAGQQKPSVSKAQKAFIEGKLDVAKEIIDATVASRDFMTDKKGKPSKNSATAWYIRGLIYVCIDTTSKAQYKSLDPNPYAVAIESFKNCQKIDSVTGSFIKDPKDPDGIRPLTTFQIDDQLARWYMAMAINKYYKTDKNYKMASEYGERALHFTPKDTLFLYLEGVHLAPAAEEYDKSIACINKYLQKGGTSQDAYVQLMIIYEDKKKDNATALKVLKEARRKYPKNEEFPKHELNIYLADNKYDLAQKIVKEEIRDSPNDAESYYRLGRLNEELNKGDSARMAFEKAMKINPDYFEPIMKLAQYYYGEGETVKTERGKLQSNDKNKAKRLELLNLLREKYKIALPYWEKCEKLRPDDEKVLYYLAQIYSSLVMDDQFERVQKKMKALGYDK